MFWVWFYRYGYIPCKWKRLQLRIKRLWRGCWPRNAARKTAGTHWQRLLGKEVAAQLLTHQGLNSLPWYVSSCSTIAQARAFALFTPDQVPPPPKPGPRLRIYWPPDGVLKADLKKKSVGVVARELKCSANALRDRCQRRGIPITPLRDRYRAALDERRRAVQGKAVRAA